MIFFHTYSFFCKWCDLFLQLAVFCCTFGVCKLPSMQGYMHACVHLSVYVHVCRSEFNVEYCSLSTSYLSVCLIVLRQDLSLAHDLIKKTRLEPRNSSDSLVSTFPLLNKGTQPDLWLCVCACVFWEMNTGLQAFKKKNFTSLSVSKSFFFFMLLMLQINLHRPSTNSVCFNGLLIFLPQSTL